MSVAYVLLGGVLGTAGLTLTNYIYSDSISENKSCMPVDMFTSKFFDKFPSLENRAFVLNTPACNLFAVKDGNSFVFFDSQMKVSIQGSMDALPNNSAAPIRIFETKNSLGSNNLNNPNLPVKGNTNEVSRYNYELGYSDIKADQAIASSRLNTSELQNELPKPPNQHVGITKKEINKDLKTLDFTILPVYKAADSKGALLTFVDITCPACRRYSDNISEINQLGYDVYLAPLPRAGNKSSSAVKMQDLWCDNFLNQQRKTDNILNSFKGNSFKPSTCSDQEFIDRFNKFVAFGEAHLNKTTPVSFTNNGITVIANHPANVFQNAFLFGDEMTNFMNKKKGSK